MLRILVLSRPCALFGFKLWIILKISSWEKLMDLSDWSVRGAKLVGSLLLFCNIEHCSAKKEWKSSAFWRKLVIKLPLWYNGGMIGVFYYDDLKMTWTLSWSSNKFYSFEITAFACNAKSLAIAIIFFFFFLDSKSRRTDESCLSSFLHLLRQMSVA